MTMNSTPCRTRISMTSSSLGFSVLAAIFIERHCIASMLVHFQQPLPRGERQHVADQREIDAVFVLLAVVGPRLRRTGDRAGDWIGRRKVARGRVRSTESRVFAVHDCCSAGFTIHKPDNS